MGENIEDATQAAEIALRFLEEMDLPLRFVHVIQIKRDFEGDWDVILELGFGVRYGELRKVEKLVEVQHIRGFRAKIGHFKGHIKEWHEIVGEIVRGDC